MHRTKRAANDKCPACIHITKTDWHIIRCPSQSLWRTELLQTLGATLTTHHTQVDLALIILQGNQGALTNQHFQMDPNNDRKPILRALVNSQRQEQHKDGNIFSKKDDSAINGLRFREDTFSTN